MSTTEECPHKLVQGFCPGEATCQFNHNPKAKKKLKIVSNSFQPEIEVVPLQQEDLEQPQQQTDEQTQFYDQTYYENPQAYDDYLNQYYEEEEENENDQDDLDDDMIDLLSEQQRKKLYFDKYKLCTCCKGYVYACEGQTCMHLGACTCKMFDVNIENE